MQSVHFSETHLNPPKLFVFEESKQKSRRLLIKKFQTVLIDEKKLIVKCTQQDKQPTTIRTTQPLDIHKLVEYFQVKILEMGQGEQRVYIGLIGKDTKLRNFPGTSLNTIGFTGHIFHYYLQDPTKRNSPGQLKLTKLPGKIIKTNTVLGMGVNTHRKIIFFTINGEKLKEEVQIPPHQDWNQFYPAVCVTRQKDTLQFIFSQKNWKFPIKAYSLQQQAKIIKSVLETQSIKNPKTAILQLVYDYIFFHGYTSTLQLLQKQRPEISKTQLGMSSHEVNTIAVSSSFNNQGIRCSTQKLPFEMIDKSDIESEDQNLKYLEDERPQKVTRKYTQMQVMDQENHIRKYSDFNDQLQSRRRQQRNSKGSSRDVVEGSNISIFSLESDPEFPLQKYILKRKEISPELNQFLRKDQIMRAIRQENIELAMKLMKQKIPAIFEAEDYIEVFMKGHIFLRKIKRETLLSAVKYAKQQKSFMKFQNNLFPVYSVEINGLNWVPFKQVFTLIANSKSNKGCLTSGQFQCFSEYTNQLILKKLGFMANSRLDTCLNHITEIQNRFKAEKVIGPIFKFDN